MSAEEVVWRGAAPIRRAVGSIAARRVSERPRWDDPAWKALIEQLVQSRADGFAADAERIAAGELELWGRSVRFEGAPDWHVDPFDGRSEGAAAMRRGKRDRKPLWEVHRQQHIVPLAGGSLVAGNDEWARLCCEQLLDWLARTKDRRGAAWSSGYETAHRLVGWAWALPLMAHTLTSEESERIGASYAEQHAFAAARPSRYSSANNHRLAELTGLLAAARLGLGAQRWEDLWSELARELERQTYADGGSREQASGYFIYVLEILWVAGLLAHSAGRDLGPVGERLRSMLAWLEHVAGSDGEPPAVGDDAEDRMLRVDYFEPRRADVLAARVETLLDGNPSLAPRPVRRGTESVVLDESGFAVLRAEIDAKPMRVIFDVGQLGYGSLAAHGHADALSVLLDLDGRPVLRDSGTYAYAPPEARDPLRSTAAHNTVVVDGTSQAKPLGPHLWGRRYETALEATSLGDQLDYVRASHDGYRRTHSGAIHTRSVAYLKPDLLVVLDRIRGSRAAEATLIWQLHPEAGSVGLGVDAVPTPHSERGLAPFSPRYTWLVEAPRLTWRAFATDVVFATVIELTTAGGQPPRFALTHEGGTTRVKISGPRRIELIEHWARPAIEVTT